MAPSRVFETAFLMTLVLKIRRKSLKRMLLPLLKISLETPINKLAKAEKGQRFAPLFSTPSFQDSEAKRFNREAKATGIQQGIICGPNDSSCMAFGLTGLRDETLRSRDFIAFA